MRAISIGAAVVVAVAAVWLLLVFFGSGSDDDRAQLDAVRTATTIVFGAGGVFALVLNALRQRSTDLTLEHQRLVAEATEQDAVECTSRRWLQVGRGRLRSTSSARIRR
jgi:hypothetical protein